MVLFRYFSLLSILAVSEALKKNMSSLSKRELLCCIGDNSGDTPKKMFCAVSLGDGQFIKTLPTFDREAIKRRL